MGEDFRIDYDLQEYKLKVNKYIEENKDNIAIYKLRNNIPLTETDYKMLERIFTANWGPKRIMNGAQEYPLWAPGAEDRQDGAGCCLRSLSSFINEQNLNADQIAFVDKVIDYIVQNGYLESAAELQTALDKPHSFIRLFDHKLREEFVRIINELKENATKIIS